VAAIASAATAATVSAAVEIDSAAAIASAVAVIGSVAVATDSTAATGSERGGGSVKSRLRAKARKKDRKNRKRTFARKKVSRLTTDKTVIVDYKDPKLLRSFLSETGKILPRRITGNTAKQQRAVALAVKRARHLALLPYPPEHGLIRSAPAFVDSKASAISLWPWPAAA
jgi:small subunit ribosomal protein S18